MSVKIGFLGGLGEVGRNCASIEIDGDVAMIDCGLMFPDEDMHGVDLVLPDFASILERKDDFNCIILTHGHEDHIGALAFLLREVSVPIYGTSLTIEFARARIEEYGITPDLRVVEQYDWVDHGPFRFTFVPVSHSIPDASGIAFDTPEGIVLHTGDFKLDPTPIDGVPTDLRSFATIGKQGVRLLLADSTNAERPGYVPSEVTVGERLDEIVGHAEGRVIVACFASHVHRVQQAINAVVRDGRKFAFIGRSMLRNSDIASELGVLDIPDGSLVELSDLIKMPDSETAIISTGSQGEPFAALSLMAAAEHRSVTLSEDDTVIISATPIPGNETRVSRVINNLYRAGVKVFHGRNTHVHVSGHAAAEELKTFYNTVRPDAMIPVHGEYRHMVANAAIGRDMRIPEVEVCQDGDVVVLEDGELRIERQAIASGYVYVDGTEVGEADAMIRDRRHLADDGVLIITVGMNLSSGEILIGPDVDSHGVTTEEDDIHALIVERVRASIEGMDEPIDIDVLRRRIRNTATRAMKKAAKRRPVVLPVVIEV
ncbi:MAG: RNase J family beta-CASP ribonuclease [Proteobacteria bacterium]|nr:RNase J family beta-CASP ribonuclease [Pseudomonadota bacterium]